MKPLGQGGDLGLLRGMNERAVLDRLRQRDDWRAAELAEETGLTRAAVVHVLTSLEAKGWVEVTAPVTMGRGRPAQRYRYRGGAGLVLGIDIGAHRIRARLADLTGAERAAADREVDAGLRRAQRLGVVKTTVKGCLTTAGVAADEVWVTVAGTTGRVDTHSGTVLESVAISGWTGFKLQDALRGRVPGAVEVFNDIELAAMAELNTGAGAGLQDVLYVHAGHRVGMRVFSRGEAIRGRHGMAGDLSRVALPGLPSVADPRGKWSDLVDLSAAAASGDRTARRSLRKAIERLADLIAIAAAVVNPQTVIIAGPLFDDRTFELPVLREALEQSCARPPDIVRAGLGVEAVVAGAVLQALKHVDDALLAGRVDRVPQLLPPPR